MSIKTLFWPLRQWTIIIKPCVSKDHLYLLVPSTDNYFFRCWRFTWSLDRSKCTLHGTSSYSFEVIRPFPGICRYIQAYFRSLKVYIPGLCRHLQGYSRSLQASSRLLQAYSVLTYRRRVFTGYRMGTIHIIFTFQKLT